MSDDTSRDGRLPEPIFELTPADEVADELEFHLEMRRRELIARGIDPVQARQLALQRFNDLQGVTAECHRIAEEREHAVRRARYVANLMQDIRFAGRMLRHRLGFALMAVLPLALGIGAASAMYSVVDGIMLRPLPFAHPERLVAIWGVEPKWQGSASSVAWNSVVIGQADFQALREQSRTMSAVAAYGRDGGMLADRSGAVEQVGAIRVTPSLFDVLGIHPALGRGFREDEGVVNGPRVAMLGWEAWQTRFGGDSGIVGRTVLYDEKPCTVVGIMPPRARIDRRVPAPAIWTPAFQSEQDLPAHHNRSYVGIGRLAPGATVAQASAEAGRIIADVKTAWHGKSEGTTGRVANLQDDQVGNTRGSLLILAGAVALLLLIACVNVATLMFGEAARRQPEIGARTALGATPGRLARQLLTESLVIALCGAAIGSLFGWGLTHALVALAPANIPGLSDVRFDLRVLLFTAACAVTTGVAFGVLPTFALLKWGRHSSARIGAGQTARGEQRIQRALVAVEVALSLVMLVGSSLLGRSLVRLSSVDPGFAPDGLLVVQLNAPSRFWSDSATVVHFQQATVDALRGITGVESVSGSNAGLFNGNSSSSPLKLPGRPADDIERRIQQRVVMPNYFHTMRVPIIAGRDFTEADNISAARAAIISAAEVKRDFANESPIGQRVNWQGHEWTVIGVAADVHYTGLATEFQPTIYIPDAQWAGNWMSYVVRANGTSNGSTLIHAIRDRLGKLNPNVTVSSVDQVPVLVQHSYAEERYRTLLGSLFGMIGAVLAGVGMFGVISRTVARRMREAGIRLALGAPAGSLATLMMRETFIGSAVGLVIGLPLAALLAHSLKPYLFGVQSIDPFAYATAVALLAAAMIVAILPPARRATRVDPVRVLRDM